MRFRLWIRTSELITRYCILNWRWVWNVRHDILACSRSCKNTDDAHQVCLLVDKLKYQLAAFPSNASFRCCAYWLHSLPCPDSYVCWHFRLRWVSRFSRGLVAFKDRTLMFCPMLAPVFSPVLAPVFFTGVYFLASIFHWHLPKIIHFPATKLQQQLSTTLQKTHYHRFCFCHTTPPVVTCIDVEEN